MYAKIKNALEKNAAFVSFLKKTSMTTDNVLGGITLLLALIVDKTFIGPTFNNIVCLFFPIQESLFLLQSPNPNVKDLKRILLVLSCFAFVVTIEPLLKNRIPLFAIMKIMFLCAVSFKQSLQESITSMLLSKVNVSRMDTDNKIAAATAASAKMKETVEKTVKEEESKKNK